MSEADENFRRRLELAADSVEARRRAEEVGPPDVVGGERDGGEDEGPGAGATRSGVDAASTTPPRGAFLRGSLSPALR